MHETTHDEVAPGGTAGGRAGGRGARLRRRRGLAVAALALGLSLALAACGSSSGGSSTSAGGTAPAKSGVDLNAVEVNSAARDKLPADIKSSGVLNVGMNAPSPPFWILSTNGSTTYSGAEYDLIMAIGKSLGLEVKLTNQAWDGLMPGLTAGRFTVIISSIGDRPERRKNINFVDYGKTGTGLLVLDKNASKYKGRSDMCGTTIGYQTGSAPGPLLEGMSTKICPSGKPMMLKALTGMQALFPALLSGQVDSLALDTASVLYWAGLKQEGGTKYAVVLGNLKDTWVNYGIGVDKKDPELARAIQAAVQGLQKAGVYKKIFDAGNIGELTIPDITINGQPSL